MKNKILLTIVLVIPSLCFGRDKGYNYGNFVIDGTEINIPNPSGFIKATELEFSKNLRKILTKSSTEIQGLQYTHFEHFISLSDALKMTSDSDKPKYLERSAFAYATKPFEKLKFSKSKFQIAKEGIRKVLSKGKSNKELKELSSKFYSNLYNNAKGSELFDQGKLEDAFAEIPKFIDFNETENSLSYSEIGIEKFTTITILLVREKIIYLTFNSSALKESKLLCDLWMKKILNENK